MENLERSKNPYFEKEAVEYDEPNENVIKEKVNIGEEYIKIASEQQMKQQINTSTSPTISRKTINAESKTDKITKKIARRVEKQALEYEKNYGYTLDYDYSSDKNIKNVRVRNSPTNDEVIELTGNAKGTYYSDEDFQIVNDDKEGIGRSYINGTLEDSIKNELVKDGSEKGIIIPGVTAESKAERGESSRTASLSRPYARGVYDERGNPNHLKNIADYSYRKIEQSASYVGQNGNIGDKVAGQTMITFTKMPRYATNVYKDFKGHTENVKYTSRLIKDIKSGALTKQEARKDALIWGKSYIGRSMNSAIRNIGYESENVSSSDDVGIQAVTKPKDTLIRTDKVIRTTRKTAKVAKQSAERTKRAVKKVKIAVEAIKKLFQNPVVLKTTIIGAAVGILAILLISVVTAVVAMFSSVTYTAKDSDLTGAYLYITELDADFEKEILDIPKDKKWSDIDQFHIYATAPKTDPLPIISYLTIKYDDFSLADVKGEIKSIYKDMYTLTYKEWEEQIEVPPDEAAPTASPSPTPTPTPTTPAEPEVKPPKTVIVKHLDVNILYTGWTGYVEKHKAELFPNNEDWQRYEEINRIGGTSLREEIAPPFVGQQTFVSQRFGWMVNPSGEKEIQNGIVIPMQYGTVINSGISGKAVVGSNSTYGNYVIIKSNKKEVTYAHCSQILVTSGTAVVKGQEIAKVGISGNSSEANLYMEYKNNGEILNPYFYIYQTQFNNMGSAGAAIGDGSYKALIAEAEKYIGFPYVWGGSSPSTSFDCSGFICWVYTQSGVKNMPRTTAYGIYQNYVTPISALDAKPGDLIFFQGTYDTPYPISHIGIYVGNGMMLHCGDPIGYTSINTPYWQSHFYGYGRIKN